MYHRNRSRSTEKGLWGLRHQTRFGQIQQRSRVSCVWGLLVLAIGTACCFHRGGHLSTVTLVKTGVQSPWAETALRQLDSRLRGQDGAGYRRLKALESDVVETTPDGDPGRQEPESAAKWLFPLWLTSQDGETVEIEARAVDQAGNVGAVSAPMEITLDNRGPSLTASQSEGWLQGTASDGSDVAWLQISLDGGAHYAPVTVVGEAWSFELASWSGSWPLPFAMLRAADAWGNVTHELLPVELEFEENYLPLILRSG